MQDASGQKCEDIRREVVQPSSERRKVVERQEILGKTTRYKAGMKKKRRLADKKKRHGKRKR